MKKVYYILPFFLLFFLLTSNNEDKRKNIMVHQFNQGYNLICFEKINKSTKFKEEPIKINKDDYVLKEDIFKSKEENISFNINQCNLKNKKEPLEKEYN